MSLKISNSLVACIVCLAMAGCQDIKNAKNTLKKTAKETKEKLEAIQLRGEMDFELQDGFKTYSKVYSHLWQTRTVTSWQDLIQAESEVPDISFSLIDAKKKGIVGVYNVAFVPNEKERGKLLIGYAPNYNPGDYWALMGDLKFQKLNKAELDKLLTSQDSPVSQ